MMGGSNQATSKITCSQLCDALSTIKYSLTDVLERDLKGVVLNVKKKRLTAQNWKKGGRYCRCYATGEWQKYRP